MAHACRMSRYIYFTYYGHAIRRRIWNNNVPFCGDGDDIGWFNPERDILIFSDRETIGPMLPPRLIARLPSLTLCLHRDKSLLNLAHRLRDELWEEWVHMAADFLDRWDIGYWFECLIDRRAAFHTINLFPFYYDDRSDLDNFILEPHQLNSTISALFVNDTVLLVDLHNDAEVKRAVTALETHKPARPCLDCLKQAYFEVNRKQRECWNIALSLYKVNWLSMYKDEEPERLVERMKKNFEGDPEWDEDENVPETKAIYDKMPRMRPVFVIMTRI
ncbi:hypothetical protein GGS26DRAFT_491724 [Hypomontagnella submonticulosa]|nr:hypothetical protein GGS26DRAFT_491724 [Hypomontagnella submonticulosa]